jgi:hypothetical protein
MYSLTILKDRSDVFLNNKSLCFLYGTLDSATYYCVASSNRKVARLDDTDLDIIEDDSWRRVFKSKGSTD